MDEDAYRRRIAVAEAYCDRRMFALDYRQRWPPRLAQRMLAGLTECVDADYYGEPRPPIYDVDLRSVIAELDACNWRLE